MITASLPGHAWRWAAWTASALIAAFHVWSEHSRKTAPLSLAFRAALAVAIAAFGLAIAAMLHNHRVGAAFLVWPLVTGVPAFLAAWLIALVLARVRPAA